MREKNNNAIQLQKVIIKQSTLAEIREGGLLWGFMMDDQRENQMDYQIRDRQDRIGGMGELILKL